MIAIDHVIAEREKKCKRGLIRKQKWRLVKAYSDMCVFPNT